MQKKLFTQIRNEWRGNLWLALELLVVSVVMWYITCSTAVWPPTWNHVALTPSTATSSGWDN